jgi:hypothetical protein
LATPPILTAIETGRASQQAALFSLAQPERAIATRRSWYAPGGDLANSLHLMICNRLQNAPDLTTQVHLE